MLDVAMTKVLFDVVRCGLCLPLNGIIEFIAIDGKSNCLYLFICMGVLHFVTEC